MFKRRFLSFRLEGSASGLDAYTRLLRQPPSHMGVAIVIVSHLRTSRATHLYEILPRCNSMPVELLYCINQIGISENHTLRSVERASSFGGA